MNDGFRVYTIVDQALTLLAGAPITPQMRAMGVLLRNSEAEYYLANRQISLAPLQSYSPDLFPLLRPVTLDQVFAPDLDLVNGQPYILKLQAGQLILEPFDPNAVQGAKGDKGDRGERGEKGEPGEDGEAGAKGAQGVKGDKGDKGERGLQGDLGPAIVLQGSRPTPADLPATGSPGDAWLVQKRIYGWNDRFRLWLDAGLVSGDKGEPGDKGDRGEAGAKGDKGDPGTKGEPGLKGDKGDRGEPGQKGDKGDTGEKGDPGTNAPDDADAINFSATWAPSINRKLGEKLNEDLPSVTDLGASPDATGSYNAGAFVACRDAGLDAGRGFDCLVPRGDYFITPPEGGIRLTLQGTGFHGSNKGNTKLINTTPDHPTFFYSDYAQAVSLRDLWLDRSVQATGSLVSGEGGNGLETGSNTNRCEIHRVVSTRNWNGALLRAAAWGDLLDFTAENNLNDGLALTNGSGGAVQWNTTGTILLQSNRRDGLRVFSYDNGAMNPANMVIILGEMFGITTFNNKGWGKNFLGLPEIPIHDIRVHVNLTGTDLLGEVHVESYGSTHKIFGGFNELAGQDGVFNASPTADCILIGENNPDGILLLGLTVKAAGKRGIISFAPKTIVCCCQIDDAGQSTTASALERAGVHLLGPDSAIQGGRILGGQYGAIVEGARSSITDTIVVGQAIAPLVYRDDTKVSVPSLPEQTPGLWKGAPGGIFDFLTPSRLSGYTFETLPSPATFVGCHIRIANRNNRPAYSDGTNWRFYKDDAIVT